MAWDSRRRPGDVDRRMNFDEESDTVVAYVRPMPEQAALWALWSTDRAVTGGKADTTGGRSTWVTCAAPSRNYFVNQRSLGLVVLPLLTSAPVRRHHWYLSESAGWSTSVPPAAWRVSLSRRIAQGHLGPGLIQAGLELSPVNLGVGGTMHP